MVQIRHGPGWNYSLRGLHLMNLVYISYNLDEILQNPLKWAGGPMRIICNIHRGVPWDFKNHASLEEIL
jgi:hypothetical protein